MFRSPLLHEQFTQAVLYIGGCLVAFVPWMAGHSCVHSSITVSIRKTLRHYLGKIGYNNISETRDGDEAVEKVFTEKPAFVFMDIVTGKLNGDDALA